MFHELVKARMRAQGWTAYRLAKESGVSLNVIDHFLRGRPMTSGKLEAILGALGIGPVDPDGRPIASAHKDDLGAV
jgi:transcriptional regulator with XRE-family HTH domain